MKKKAAAREQMRKDIIAEAAGDLAPEEEEKLKNSLALNRCDNATRSTAVPCASSMEQSQC